MMTDTTRSTLELWLVRHGETTWNALGRWQGHADAPLSEYGIAQAHRLAARLAGQRFDAVLSSDLSRASDTARIVAATLEGAPNVILEPLWREIDVGELSGLTYEQAVARGLHHRDTAFDHRHPGGESSADLAVRAGEGIDRLRLERMGQRVIVFSHGGTIRRALAVVLGEADARWTFAFRIGNTSISRFTLASDGENRCLTFNDTAHLEDVFQPHPELA
jgi:2,3-bisphosphoglycerate-dependent phosphoglycerate mutase